MRTLMKKYHRGEKGFTLLELLIVVVILGLLAGLLVPRLITFLGTGNVAAANTEVANVETAALAYYADNYNLPSPWPVSCNSTSSGTSLIDPPQGLTNGYIDKGTKYFDYPFNQTTGKVDDTAMTGKTSYTGSLKWDVANHKWVKQ